MKAKAILFALAFAAACLTAGAQSTETAQLKLTRISYEGSASLNIHFNPFTAGVSTLHGIRFSPPEGDLVQPSFLVGINLGGLPWPGGMVCYYAVQPRIYFPKIAAAEYYLACDIGANTGIGKDGQNGGLAADTSFYLGPTVGGAFDLKGGLALDLSFRIQFLERIFTTKHQNQVPAVSLGIGLRF